MSVGCGGSFLPGPLLSGLVAPVLSGGDRHLVLRAAAWKAALGSGVSSQGLQQLAHSVHWWATSHHRCEESETALSRAVLSREINFQLY